MLNRSVGADDGITEGTSVLLSPPIVGANDGESEGVSVSQSSLPFPFPLLEPLPLPLPLLLNICGAFEDVGLGDGPTEYFLLDFLDPFAHL